MARVTILGQIKTSLAKASCSSLRERQKDTYEVNFFLSVSTQSPATCRLRSSSTRSSTMDYGYSSRQNSVRAHSLLLRAHGTICTHLHYVASKIGSNYHSL